MGNERVNTMERQLIGRCGAYCGDCDWKEKMNCPGCQIRAGRPFWGLCEIAICSIEKRNFHCGECHLLPCYKLQAAFEMPDHGDNGERLTNLKNWAQGKDFFVKLTIKIKTV